MVFAELDYAAHYSRVHPELRALLESIFENVQSGLQGDSWFWILDGGERVEVDTFSSMTHQIKSARPGPHVQKVIQALARKYRLRIHATPVRQPHEGDDDAAA